ncbi:hypothetical protein [Nocardiopsis kunsanensis]|uniref:Uncharacterized protein n=1 Tax=Nocardiopsis kunsanensis TaxID=141693 RepID=A0A918XGV3_9ACTN|nr:hypothetical protein [Nocardiopsis kunsanensis]GHD30087.1 hypothetical protein GCM10007147_31600 [Nocardiopsis kunsanensis]
MATTPPARTTDLRDEIAAAISTGRELGPEFDTEIADSLATRMESETVPKRESETAPKREGEHERPGSATRGERTRKVALWSTLAVIAAAWAAEDAPEALAPWAILAVVSVVLHVVRTWRS